MFSKTLKSKPKMTKIDTMPIPVLNKKCDK